MISDSVRLLSQHQTRSYSAQQIEEMAVDYCGPSRGLKQQVGRNITRMPPEQVQELVARIRKEGGTPSARMLQRASAPPPASALPVNRFATSNGNGHDQPAPATPAGNKKERIYWSEDDWEFVTKGVMRLRLDDAAISIYTLAERMIQQMPQDNRRRATKSLIDQLNKRIKAANRYWLDLEAEVQLLREHNQTLVAQHLSTEEVLSTLTREEICQRYGDVVLEDFTADELIVKFSIDTVISCLPTSALMAHALGRCFESFRQQSQDMNENTAMLGRILADMPAEKVHRQQQAIANAATPLPRVALVGFKQDQGAFLGDALRNKAKVEVFAQNRTKFDSQADIIVVWNRFVTHPMRISVQKHAKKGAHIIFHENYDEGGRGLKAALLEIERTLNK